MEPIEADLTETQQEEPKASSLFNDEVATVPAAEGELAQGYALPRVPNANRHPFLDALGNR